MLLLRVGPAELKQALRRDFAVLLNNESHDRTAMLQSAIGMPIRTVPGPSSVLAVQWLIEQVAGQERQSGSRYMRDSSATCPRRYRGTPRTGPERNSSSASSSIPANVRSSGGFLRDFRRNVNIPQQARALRGRRLGAITRCNCGSRGVQVDQILRDENALFCREFHRRATFPGFHCFKFSARPATAFSTVLLTG